MIDEHRDEVLITQFRQWIQETRAQAADIERTKIDTSPPEVGLYRLVEEFTALRHEVKLETKSARNLQEQFDSLLPAVKQAIDTFQSVVPKEQQAAITAARPLVEAIADLDEALDRGRSEIEKARERLALKPREALAHKLHTLYDGLSWMGRLRYRAYHESILAVIRQTTEYDPTFMDALLEGYGLIQARLRRAMQTEQIARIDCIGLPVDPDRMTVVEVVDSDQFAAGHVIEEIRRGYTWRDRVLRFAEVRAARNSGLPVEVTEEE